MTEFVRTLKKIYWRLFFVSMAVLIVEALLAPARFLTFFGLISFALLGVFSPLLCSYLARRHGVNVIDKEKGWMGYHCDWFNVQQTFMLCCMPTAIAFGILYSFVPRME